MWHLDKVQIFHYYSKNSIIDCKPCYKQAPGKGCSMLKAEMFILAKQEDFKKTIFCKGG